MVFIVPFNNNKQQINIFFHFWKRCLSWPSTSSNHQMQLYLLPSNRELFFRLKRQAKNHWYIFPRLTETQSWNQKEHKGSKGFFLQKKHEETNWGPKSDTERSQLHWGAPALRSELHPVHTAVLTQYRLMWGLFAVAHLLKILLKRLFIQSYYHKYKMPFNNQLSGRHLHSRLFSHQSGYLLEGTIMHIKSHFIISFQVGICAPGCLVISGSHFSGV